MLRRFALLLTLLLSLLDGLGLPNVAHAQTLTVEIEGELLTEATPLAPSTPAPAAASLDVALEGVVLVRPLEDDAPPPLARPVPRAVPPRPPMPPAPVAHGIPPQPMPAPAPPGSNSIEGASHVGLTLESFDFGSHELRLARPEVSALGGTELDRGWQEDAAFSIPPLIGFEVGAGMRAHGILRGPELRLGLFGSEIEGPFTPVPGRPGFDLAVRNLLGLRAELTIGLQAELGPVTPYIVGRAIAGVAFVDVDVRHDELGGLGTDTIEVGYGQLGIEAGMDVEIEEGITLGLAYRGAWVGPESHGGILTLGFHGGE